MKYKLLFLLIVISLFLTINSYATTCSSSGTSVSCSDGVSISMSSCSVSIVGFSCCSNTGSKIDSISWNWLGCSCRSNNYNECGAFERAYSHSCSGTSRSYTYTNCGSDPGCDSSTGQCCVPDCTDKDCGSDGCASVCGSDPADCTANFGTCSASGSQACSGTTYGTCDAVDPRIATCEGLTCGDDGCGGECGSCSGTCNAGTCETCTDGAQNNGETAVDCGGDNCAACGTPTCGTDSATSSCLPNACNTYSSCSTLADTNCVCSGSLNHCTGSCAPAADDTPAECSSYCSAKTAPSGGWTYKSDGCSPADFTDNYRCDGDKRKRYVFVSASDAVCDIDDYPKCTCVYTKNCPSGEECNPNSYSCGVNTCSGPTAFCSTWGAGTWSSTCRSTVDWQLKTPTCSSSTLKHIIYSWAGDDWCSGDNRCYCTKSSACPTGETCSDSENAECVCNNPSGCQTGLTAKCRTGISCDCNDECSSGYCSGGVCTTPPTCTDTASCDDCLYYDAGASCDCDDECSGASTCGTGETCESCSDSILNQDETEVDCGGTICDACPEVCDVFESPAKTCDSTSPCNCGNSCNTAANHKQTSPCDCADGSMSGV
ncbi:MAG: hypothetical protein QF824_05510, partial [Candidatus Woesearchaeota archaeon]|nr:hypothetical protein [Candidatus Woesearchaeota archaeon]